MPRAYTYKVIAEPEKLAVPIETFKLHLKRKGSSEDALLNLYLQAAIDYAEGITRRCLINRSIRTYRDFFPTPCQNEGYYPYGIIPSSGRGINDIDSNVGFELRKSKLQSIVEVSYISSGTPVIVDPTDYYFTDEDDYSELLAVNSWPEDADRRMQAVTIDFVCGFGPTPKSVPKDYQVAIMQHATAIRANRGDCSDTACGNVVPALAKSFYLQNRIENL